jgi:hypothetical protein
MAQHQTDMHIDLQQTHKLGAPQLDVGELHHAALQPLAFLHPLNQLRHSLTNRL